MSEKEYHLKELTRIADLMECYRDDDSREGRSMMRVLRREYRFHFEKSGISMNPLKVGERG